MLGRLIFSLRYVLWLIGNLQRSLGKPPEYVIFTLEGAYPELRTQRAGFLQRRLFPGTLLSLQELGAQFKTLQGDPRVKGVVLHLRGLQMPASHAQTLRGYIAQLRSSGKRVVTWSTSYDNTRYYIATAADEILLQTGGDASPLGLHATHVFLADALERVGIKADFVQISPYKSAADPLMRSSMSDEMREMTNWLLDAYYEEFISAVSSGRGLDQDAAKALVDRAPYTDLKALESGVVDKIISEEDLPVYLGTTNPGTSQSGTSQSGTSQSGITQSGVEEKPVRLATWEAVRKKLRRPPPIRAGRYVALIRVEGNIVDGWSQQPPSKSPLPLPLVFNPRAGDLTVVQQARVALRDRRAAAVVLYVNSGGGSASASEAMAAALQKIADKKPLVAVMGPVAASGGYYVATPARWISAQPGTITGSIGVLTGKVITSGLMDKLLFRRESIGRGAHADFQGTEKPFSEEERQTVRENIERVYDVFLDRVSAGRNLTREAVDAIAGGRVWTGSQALDRGLVDELGGLEEGLAKARQLAGLNPRAPFREIRTDRQYSQPPMPAAAALNLSKREPTLAETALANASLPNPASLLSYAVEGLDLFAAKKALCLNELLTLEPDVYP